MQNEENCFLCLDWKTKNLKSICRFPSKTIFLAVGDHNILELTYKKDALFC